MSSEEQFKSLQDSISACLVETTRTAGQLAAEDLNFLRSSDPSVAKRLDKQASRLLGFARRLAQSATAGTEVQPPVLSGLDSIDDNWQGIVDVIDNLLEKADVCLDEYTGTTKKPTSAQKDAASAAEEREKVSGGNNQKQRLLKPQLLFKCAPNNSDNTPFKPLLQSKPHALVPLEESIGPSTLEDGRKEYRHPYEAEVTNSNYPDPTYIASEPTAFLPYESTTATFVDTPDKVTSMLSELKKAKEIAIDLEHHDTHSYVGLVSLMQISTRERDWIVDTLKPWREDLQVLNEVFADPKILKVLHGASMDIIWLQRDLGLYIVGLFDTYYASRFLGYPRHSLAHLLTKFVNFDAQKQYQMADWRIRPLPKAMFDYARSDTHFLLYIYDNVRNELITKSNAHPLERNLIESVLEESKKVSLQRYERPVYDSEQGLGAGGWYGMLIRTPALFSREQFAVFKAVHKWRDDIARKEDESLAFVMSKTALFNVARDMPDQMPQLLGCLAHVSVPVRRRLGELLEVIKRGKAQGQTGPDMNEFLKAHPATIAYETDKAERLSKIKATQATIIPSVAQVLKNEIHNAPIAAVRAESSQFWGSTINGYKRQRLNDSLEHQPLQLRLHVPLPRFTAEIFSTSNGSEDNKPAKPTAPPEHPYIKDRAPIEEDEIFTIREAGGSRKRKASRHSPSPSRSSPPLPESTSNDNEDSIPFDPDTHSTPSRISRKAAKRARKKREKEARQDAATAVDGEKEAPFDYAAAPSVLNPKVGKAERERGKGRDKNKVKKGGVDGFDPYSKSMDAPKGMRRARKEVAGKSQTFGR